MGIFLRQDAWTKLDVNSMELAVAINRLDDTQLSKHFYDRNFRICIAVSPIIVFSHGLALLSMFGICLNRKETKGSGDL